MSLREEPDCKRIWTGWVEDGNLAQDLGESFTATVGKKPFFTFSLLSIFPIGEFGPEPYIHTCTQVNECYMCQLTRQVGGHVVSACM